MNKQGLLWSVGGVAAAIGLAGLVAMSYYAEDQKIEREFAQGDYSRVHEYRDLMFDENPRKVMNAYMNALLEGDEPVEMELINMFLAHQNTLRYPKKLNYEGYALIDVIAQEVFKAEQYGEPLSDTVQEAVTLLEPTLNNVDEYSYACNVGAHGSIVVKDGIFGAQNTFFWADDDGEPYVRATLAKGRSGDLQNMIYYDVLENTTFDLPSFSGPRTYKFTPRVTQVRVADNFEDTLYVRVDLESELLGTAVGSNSRYFILDTSTCDRLDPLEAQLQIKQFMANAET
ncbi:MAG: hypothetical protein AWU57_544 [Marinobacter sp. T13-3]|nr:MAG: hypothetical protein AWU57_544 [Marinobacter sp. T13-3]